MRIGKSRNPSCYKCDKCGKIIRFQHNEGFKGIQKYYKSYVRVPYKDFDLCDNCEKKFREWLSTREIPEMKDILDTFPKYEEV